MSTYDNEQKETKHVFSVSNCRSRQACIYLINFFEYTLMLDPALLALLGLARNKYKTRPRDSRSEIHLQCCAGPESCLWLKCG